jgi:oligosaccharide repeat unit polymerase
MFFLFSFFFFGVAPLLQYSNNVRIFGGVLTENDYFFTNLIVIAILVLYTFFYSIFYKYTNGVMKSSFVDKFKVPIKLSSKQIVVLLCISAFSFFILFRYNHYSLLNMLVRRWETGIAISQNIVENKSIMLITTNFFRPISMVCFLYYGFIQKKQKVIYVILFGLAVLTCFPTGMARFAAASLYIPVCLMLFSTLRKQNVFSLCLMFGLLVFFPFLDQFRRFSTQTGIKKFAFNFDMFMQGHFDSYANFAQILSHNIITDGRQLLGVLFFWVPRSLWPNKPIGTGAFLSDKIGLSYNNISANFFAEGYANFGFIGILLFVLLIAFITAKFDKLYWTNNAFKLNNIFTVFYLILLGLFFFILRGDLLSSFAYTMGYIASVFFVFFIVNRLK